MKFEDARTIDSICWQMRQADFVRSANRARIDELFNGWPPFSTEEVQKNQTAVNVNFLEGTRLAHDARSQFNNAFLKAGAFFAARTDYGAPHRRRHYGVEVSRLINRIMKNSIRYMECSRSQFALDVLHGIGPSAWENPDIWCCDAQGITDVGIPARTLLTMQNLPFFYIYRPLTHPELWRMTQGPRVDPGWNMPLVKKCLNWLQQETLELIGQNWQDYWSPEKVSEAAKADGGFFVGDQVATVNVFDFYFLDHDSKDQGWRRRMLLDAWSTPTASMGSQGQQVVSLVKDTKKEEAFYGKEDGYQFLYTSKDRKVAARRENIIAFQFADLSAVAPFQYHSVRSLGFLLYSILHLQNRLRCAVTEAVFENLLQQFRIKSMDDVQRALRLKMHNFSFIDDNLTPIPANERWHPDQGLVQLGLAENSGLIQEHSSSYTQNQNYSSDRTEKTKFQVMAEMNAMTQLTGAALNQAYSYKKFEYIEIVRRFMKKNSSDPEVREFRAQALTAKVPEKVLVAEAWDVEPERVMGGGNKSLEMAIAQQLMEWYDRFAPPQQREVFRDAILAITDDPAQADRLVPDEPHISDSVHDTELAFGALMSGTQVTPKPGLNPAEVAGKTIQLMGQKVSLIQHQGNVGTPQEVMGLMLAAKYAQAFIQMLAPDPKSKQLVRRLNDGLAGVMREVNGFMQRQQQAAKAAQRNGNGRVGPDPKDIVKAQLQQQIGQQKIRNLRVSHALRTAQHKLQFEQKYAQDEQTHAADMARKRAEAALDIQAEQEKTRLKFLNPSGEE